MRREVYVMGGIVLGLMTISVVGGNWLMSSLVEESLSMRPQTVAEAYFETPVSEMQDIKGGGSNWLGYDHKVRFHTNVPVKIKNSDNYESFQPDEADIRSFKLDFPDDATQFEDGEPLECLRVKVAEPTPGSSGRYLVTNAKSHTYFFHSWNAH